MLDTIRRHQQSWLTYVIFLFLIFVFAVSFGPGSSSCQGVTGSTYAALVDGDYIRQQDFARAYSSQMEQMRRYAQLQGYPLDDRILEQMNLKQQVIDGLIQQKLLAQEAKRHGLRVTDEELYQHILKLFGATELDPQDYRSRVESYFQTTVAKFEEEQRHQLAAQKLLQVIEDGVSVSDEELRQQYLRERDRAMIEYVRFDLTGIELEEPTAQAVDALVASEPKAIAERYQMDQGRYRTPEQRQARHIMIALAKDASEADVARARSQLMTAKEQIEQGADFAAVAQEQSQDAATKAQGGDLGLHQRGELPPALEQAIFSLAPEKMTSEPVRTDSGLHLVQLVAVKAPEPRPLEEVKREVATSILRERSAEAQLKQAADELLAAVQSGKKLEDLTVSEEAASDKAKVGDKPVRYESPWIVRGQEAIPRIGISPEMQKDIFTLTEEAPLAPRTYKIGRAYYVVKLKDREVPDAAKFESEKALLKQQALSAKRTRVVQDWLTHLRDEAQVELNGQIFGERAGADQG